MAVGKARNAISFPWQGGRRYSQRLGPNGQGLELWKPDTQGGSWSRATARLTPSEGQLLPTSCPDGSRPSKGLCRECSVPREVRLFPLGEGESSACAGNAHVCRRRLPSAATWDRLGLQRAAACWTVPRAGDPRAADMEAAEPGDQGPGPGSSLSTHPRCMARGESPRLSEP